MLDRCPSEKCFLSHYPPAVGDPGYQIPVLCKSHFDVGAQMPSFEAKNFNIDVGPGLLPAPSPASRALPCCVRGFAVQRMSDPFPATSRIVTPCVSV